ncbi:MAG: thermonuclease family protein [Alkalilacustris sp.]
MLGFSAAGAASATGASVNPAHAVIEGPATVIDGDTLEVAGTRIRLQGIDAPERDQTCIGADGVPWPCGLRSTEAARSRFGGRVLRCEDLGERTWGRVVARCFDGPVDVAEAMLHEGMARACPRYALQHSHSRAYLSVEAAAMARRAGVFAGPPPPRAGFCAPEPASEPVRSAQTCQIKGNINASGERIYHLPGQRFYDVTRIDTAAGERWFCTEDDARAAGWRAARR